MMPSGQDAGSDWEDTTDGHPTSSKHHLEDTKRAPSPHIENLPAELRVLILSKAPDLPTLRALVRASPVLHAQYRNDRNSILRACLSRELDGLLIDAYATVMSRVCELGTPRTDETITDYLDSYQTWLSSSGPFPNIKLIDPGRLRWIAAYHISIARPLARLYSKWALANLKKAIVSSAGQQGVAATENNESAEEEIANVASSSGQDVELSRSEEIRVFRALYRYETFHHLFGQNKGQRHGAFRHPDINELFFCLFDPWEAEAIGCIYTFVRHRYEDIFNQVKPDLHPTNEKFRQKNGVFNPTGSHDLEWEHDGEHT